MWAVRSLEVYPYVQAFVAAEWRARDEQADLVPINSGASSTRGS